MALEDIQSAVLDAARKEAERIVAAARKAADDRLAPHRETLRRESERRFAAESRAIDEEFARQQVLAKGVAHKRVLDRRNQALKDVFARAERQILSWSPDEYREVMRRLLERATDGAGGTLRVHPDDRALIDGLVYELNASRSADQALSVDDADPLPERGGFVFVSPSFEVDQTLDTLMTDIEHEMSPQIAAALFGKQ